MALNNYMAKGYLVKPMTVTTYIKNNEQHLLGRFTLAVTGNAKDSVDYIPFTLFNENIIAFMQKWCVQGTQLLVQSIIHNSCYKKTSGKGKEKSEQKVYAIECIVNQVELLSQPKSYYEEKQSNEVSKAKQQKG